MSRINNGIISTYLRQLYLVNQHQDLAENNEPNQLVEMVDALAVMAEAIGNANVTMLASIDEDAINVLIERTRLQANEGKKDDKDELFTDIA